MEKSTPQKSIKINNEYIFDVLWKCLVKEGYLWNKKPFRNKKQMVEAILLDEVEELTKFISKSVLRFEDKATPGKKKSR